MNASDGMNYAPTGKPHPVCEKESLYLLQWPWNMAMLRHVQWPFGSRRGANVCIRQGS